MSTALLNLLFAQTICKQAYENEKDDSPPTREYFVKLAQDLKSHPLNSEFNLSPEACRSLYSALLPSNSKPSTYMLKPLLEKLYESYKRDIVIQIKNDEHEFRTKLREIEQIEKGKWDTELMKEMESEKSQAYQQQQLKLQRELQQRQELQKQKHLQEQQQKRQKKQQSEEAEVEAEAEKKTAHEGSEKESEQAERREKEDEKNEDEKVEERAGKQATETEQKAEVKAEKEKEAGEGDEEEEAEEEEDDEEGGGGGEEEGEEADDDSARPSRMNKKRKRQASPSPAANKRFQSSVYPLLNNISSNKSASFFTTSVNPNDAPNYYSLVHSPTDLRTIKAKVKDGVITSIDELERELENMFANAVMYNKWDSDMSVWAREMQLETESLIAMFRGVQANENKRRK